MCGPAALAVLQVASSVLQYQQQSEAANQQNQANSIQRQQLRDQQSREQMDASRQRSQQWEQDAAEANAYAAEHRKQFATMDALIGEGAGGVSAQRKFSSMGVKQGQDLATLASNSTNARSEISLGENSRLQSSNNQLASIRDVGQPSILGTALQIGGAAVGYKSGMDKIAGAGTAASSTASTPTSTWSPVPDALRYPSRT